MPDLFTTEPAASTPAWRTVDLGGRCELRLLLLEGRVLIGRSYRDDPVIDVPALLIPIEAVPDVVAALQELVGA